MQTIYYETSNYIRHEGNVVDLAAYRQKLAAVAGGDWAPGEEALPPAAQGDVVTLPVRRSLSPEERAHRRKVRRLGILLDLCASGAILVLTVTAVVQFVRL